MIQNEGFFFRDLKGNLNVLLENNCVYELQNICTRAQNSETGGILLGYYNKKHDTARITKVFDSPPDSTYGKTWFHRGIRGLQAIIDAYWYNKDSYYLGEWHYHPLSDPEPSEIDKKQMFEIASSRLYKCPEPILFIIGGGANLGWKYQVIVFPRREDNPVYLSFG